MPPPGTNPLVYSLFKGDFTASQARDVTHASTCRGALLAWASSDTAWTKMSSDAGGRSDYAPTGEVSSQATSCRQRWRVACSVENFLRVAPDGGGCYLQVRGTESVAAVRPVFGCSRLLPPHSAKLLPLNPCCMARRLRHNRLPTGAAESCCIFQHAYPAHNT